ncbi:MULTISPECIES: hypothetical protein [Paenibacillus]|uniref:Uncharacterized protein n=1 Tax=Paenibacillus campinasensis TaxID=66347 RepID=A0A268F387_9BACL|nr:MULTISPECIES: hypothetical protein [Paenibacillus]MUG64854.1 hypothetical protein [Paenibacillus campinasensis]PAD79832.1 hypothetical protein CHH67_02345 [Paenibacillus campinasensis]PAK53445.1 hypothetical protein CHH75_09305 [Paenibacillus sp. 7541]
MDSESKSLEERIVESYRQDEDMMILVFAQWCVNQGLDPAELYRKAYPDQPVNEPLARALALTVPKEEAGDIADHTVLGVLSLYGNDDLAAVVTEAMEQIAAARKSGT